MDGVDIVIVGAGVIGLAIGRQLAMAGHEIIIFEREHAIGTGISSRNSEVIHAGLYYPPNSLKASLCVKGKRLLYDFCAAHNVPHLKCGKLIVAKSEREQLILATIKKRAEQCDVMDIEWLNKPDIQQLEPKLDADFALMSPSTGIIDGHQYMLSLQGEYEAHGGVISFNTNFLSASREGQDSHWMIKAGGAEIIDIKANWIINAAGLDAQNVARRIAPCPDEIIPTSYFAKGHYFIYSSKPPFKHLVYPVPELGGLGIHATQDLGGQVKFGPDVEWVDNIDYGFDDSRRDRFVEVIQKYFPGLNADKLIPGYTGIRPKLSGLGEASADFRIDGPSFHNITGLINLFGLESPGLTSSLAIASEVADQIRSI